MIKLADSYGFGYTKRMAIKRIDNILNGSGVEHLGAWQPIETAPKDGRELWFWNGENYGVGHWAIDREPETIFKHFRPFCRDGKPSDFTQIPNPRAGEIRYQWWFVEWASNDRDYDGHYTGPEIPTHWSPPLTPPK